MAISFKEMSRRLIKISLQDLQKEVQNLVETDRNRELRKAKINELDFGLRPDRNKIGSYASNDYAHKKNNINALAGFGNVDLILTGAWSNSLFPIKKGNGFFFDSSNDKNAELIAKYGLDILGLNQKTFDKIQKEIYAKEIFLYIKKRIGQ